MPAPRRSLRGLLRRGVAGLLTASILLGALGAGAEPTAADKATARRLFAEGRRKRSAGDLRGALGAFQAADAIMEVPTTSVDLGCTQLDLGLFVEGQESLTRALRWKGRGPTPRAYADAQAEAARLLAELSPHIPTLRIEARVPGAARDAYEVNVDGHVVPAAALAEPYAVNPGAHVVTLVVGKVVAKEARVEVKDGGSAVVVLEAPAVAVEEAAPPSPSPPAAVAVAPAAPMPPPADPPRAPWVKPVVLTGLAVAVAGLATGAVAGGVSLAKTAEASSVCPDRRCPISHEDVLTTATTAATVADVALIAAGAGAAVALGAWLWPRPSVEAGARAFLAPTPGGAFVGGGVAF